LNKLLYYQLSEDSVFRLPAETQWEDAARGGSWRSILQGCRVSCRFKSSPNEKASNCEVRLVLVKMRWWD